MRICAVVVTHNRPDELRHCIQGLENQTKMPDTVLVVDNGSTVDSARLPTETLRTHILQLPTNLGGAGGFAAGLRWTLEHGYDWTWMMDDDALPQPTALEALFPSMERHQDELVALASRTVADTREVVEMSATAEMRIDHAMFVGFAVPRCVVQELGVPREDFFIYTDDSDYCWRIQRAGGEIYRVPASVIVHADWARAPDNLIVSLRGRKILLYPRVAGWKKYYLARNRIIAGRGDSLMRAVVGVAQSLVLLIATAVLAPRDLRLVVRGLLDGIRGRAGATIVPN